MNIKRSSFAFLLVSMFPLLAHAAEEEHGGGQSVLVGLFWTVLPILFVGVLVWWFLRGPVRKQQRRSENYIADQKQHNERVEQLLERIAKAAERKETDGH